MQSFADVLPTGEFEYDTHLEYNDEGRPLVGRAVITDEEKTAEDELDGILMLVSLQV